MASLVVPRSHHQLLSLLVITIIICFTAVADSARVASAPEPAATTAAKPIEVYPGCSKSIMPKRCSSMLSNFIKILGETKALIAGPQLGAAKLKSDSCITECAKVVDEATPKATAAKADEEALKKLNGYVDAAAIHNDGPIGPCECNCPEPCTKDESAAVTKLGEATKSMRSLGGLLGSVFLDTEDKKAEAVEMEKSMDSGVFHVSCGLTKQPQKCTDELSALAKTTSEAVDKAWELKSPPATSTTAIDSFMRGCSDAVLNVNEAIEVAEVQLKNLADIRATIHSYVQGDGKKPPVCKFSCPPPPPEKPCTANETAAVDKLSGVRDAWVAADKFLTELLPPAQEAPKKN